MGKTVEVTAPTGNAAPNLTGKHIIVATGSRPRTLGLEPDGKLVWTYFKHSYRTPCPSHY